MLTKRKAKKAGKFVVKEAVKQELRLLLTGLNHTIKEHFTHKKMTPIRVTVGRGKRR